MTAEDRGLPPERKAREPFRIGTETQWGRVGAVGILSGERYYWLVHHSGVVSMVPAVMLETPDLAIAVGRVDTGGGG